MKKIVSIYFLVILYFLAIFRPFLPVIEYYINYDYIAEQLCENRNKPILACNGKCYLAKEIAETSPERSDDHNSTIPSIDFEKTPLITKPKALYKTICFDLTSLNEFNFTECSKTNSVVNGIFRPPKNLV